MVKSGINSLLLALSIAIGLVAAELIARSVLDPVDFLLPTLIEDPVLNHRIAERSGGHDEWGFRNTRVPRESQIVAIGDSMTYGMEARMRDSWPWQLAEITGSSVYNMGLGGYGPLQYLELLKTKARQLNPRIVIVALYLGNDILDSVFLSVNSAHWRHEYPDAPPAADSVALEIEVDDTTPKFMGSLRQLLANRSITYRVVNLSPIGSFVRDRELPESANAPEMFVNSSRLIFRPEGRLGALDLAEPRVAYGLTIALDVLDRMSNETQAELLIVILPTKERVYARQLSEVSNGKWRQMVGAIQAAEDQVRERILNHLKASDIWHLDLLLALESESTAQALYPIHDDHLNAAGSRVVAHAIAKELEGFDLH